MKTLNVAILHGIGTNEIGYADDLIEGIEKEFKLAVERQGGRPSDGIAKINFRQIVWDDILGVNQAKLKVILEKRLKNKKRKTFLGFLAALGIVPLAAVCIISQIIFKQPILSTAISLIIGYAIYFFGSKIYFQLRTAFASEYMMDIIGYLNSDVKAKIQQRIKEELLFINGDKEPVTFIAHSLGTVIASDFIYDRQEKKDFGDFRLNNFFTMGSPIALFALRWGVELFNKPIAIDEPNGKWINILDVDDPIAYPLKELNAAYDKVVSADIEVNAGYLGIAHVQYWRTKDVHKIIADKLAAEIYT